MGFDLELHGLAATLDTLDDIRFRFNDDAVYVVGTNVEYAVYVEFGTSKQRAQPYLRPAVRTARANLSAIAARSRSHPDLIRRVALTVERHAKRLVPVDTGNLRASIRAERVR